MGLPTVELPSTVDDATGISFRSLTRKEARHVQLGFHVADTTDLAAVEEAADRCEVYILSCGLGLPEEDIEAWRDRLDNPTAERIVEGILRLSGLAEGPAPLASTNGHS